MRLEGCTANVVKQDATDKSPRGGEIRTEIICPPAQSRRRTRRVLNRTPEGGGGSKAALCSPGSLTRGDWPTRQLPFAGRIDSRSDFCRSREARLTRPTKVKARPITRVISFPLRLAVGAGRLRERLQDSAPFAPWRLCVEVVAQQYPLNRASRDRQKAVRESIRPANGGSSSANPPGSETRGYTGQRCCPHPLRGFC